MPNNVDLAGGPGQMCKIFPGPVGAPWHLFEEREQNGSSARGPWSPGLISPSPLNGHRLRSSYRRTLVIILSCSSI